MSPYLAVGLSLLHHSEKVQEREVEFRENKSSLSS
jgi:hypothetical protein